MEKRLIGNVKPKKGVDYLTEQDMIELDARYAKSAVQANIPSNSSVTFVFDASVHTALVACRAEEPDTYALLAYSGYGTGGIHSNVDKICGKSSSIAYGIRPESTDNTHGFTLWNHGSTDIVCTVFYLMGNIPSVLPGDGGATEIS